MVKSGVNKIYTKAHNDIRTDKTIIHTRVVISFELKWWHRSP